MAFEETNRRRKPDEDEDGVVLSAEGDNERSSLRRFSPASVTSAAGPGPPPVPSNPIFIPDFVHMDRDHTVPSRTRRHQEEVALRLNALARLGQLVQTDIKEWQLGYQSSDAQAWNPTPGPPLTVQEAFDRIAALLKDLNGGTGP